jgi:hypothetical protein
MAETQLDVLLGFALKLPDGSVRELAQRQKALLIGLALSPDGLTNAEQWIWYQNYPGNFSPAGFDQCTDGEGLRAHRARINRVIAPLSIVKGASDRARLDAEDEAVDARRFLVCADRAKAATCESVAAWRDALAQWPRRLPLAVVHPYVQATLFEPIEVVYRQSVIDYGQAVIGDTQRLSSDIREAIRLADGLIAEIEATHGPLGLNSDLGPVARSAKTDARELRTLALRLRLLAPMPGQDDATSAYVGHYQAQCSAACPQQLPSQERTQDVRVPLEEIYVSLSLGPSSSTEIAAAHDLARDDQAPLSWVTDPNLKTIDALLRTQRWVAVLGAPGSGKSTLLQWLALQHARAIRDQLEHVTVSNAVLGRSGGGSVDLGPTRLPILVSLADYAETASRVPCDSAPPGNETVKLEPLLDFLPKHAVLASPLPLGQDDAARVIGTWLKANRVFLLLDGIDEVRDDSVVAEVQREVIYFCERNIVDPSAPSAFGGPDGVLQDGNHWPEQLSEPAEAGGSQVIVTSREGGYGRAPLRSPFCVVRLNDLSDADITRFVANWCKAVEHWQAQMQVLAGSPLSEEEIARRASDRCRELLQALQRLPRIGRACRNPLALTALALLQREDRLHLPTPFAIFEALLTVLITRRARPGWSSYGQAIDVLGPVALWMHSSGLRSAHRDEVMQEIRRALTRFIELDDPRLDAHAEEFFAVATEDYSLLVETSRGYFGFFMHNLFRELLAGIELSRDPTQFLNWILEHRAEPHWEEVLIFGVANVGTHHPAGLDSLLAGLLEDDSDTSSADLQVGPLKAARALLEMDRGSPATVERIITSLVTAGAEPGVSRRLSSRLAEVIAALLDSPLELRSRQAETILLRLLGKPERRTFICTAIGLSAYSSAELLDAVDAACCDPGFPRIAPAVRAQLATRLSERGVVLNQRYTSVGEVSDTLDTLDHLPSLMKFVKSSSHWVDPPVARFLRYVAAKQPLTEEEVLVLLLSALKDETGDGFDSLARLGRALDSERVHDWIQDQAAAAAVDMESAARYFAIFAPTNLGLEAFDDRVVLTYLAERLQLTPSHVDIAWRHMRPRSPLFDPAWRLLSRLALTNTYLPASRAAIDAVRSLLANPDTCPHGQLLLSRLRVRDDSRDEVAPELREILDAGSDPLMRGAAVMLLADGKSAITASQMRIVAEILADEDDPLRLTALRALAVSRDIALVPDDALRAAAEAQEDRRAAGDVAAVYGLSIVSTQVIHGDITRLLEWAAQGDPIPWDSGLVPPDQIASAVSAIQAGCPGATPLLNGCLTGVAHRGPPDDLNLAPLHEIAVEAAKSADAEVAAQIFALAAVGSGRGSDIPGLIEDLLAAGDANAAAAAIRAAASGLHHRREGATADAIAGIVDSVQDSDRPWIMAGAGLAIDAARLDSAAEVLAGVARRTATERHAARAILFALSAVHPWHNGDGFERHYLTVAEKFAETVSQLSALLAVCSEALSSREQEDWPERRAAIYLISGVARFYPGLLVRWAPPNLPAHLAAACRDPNSFSVRRTAFRLLARFPDLDQSITDLIKDATRDTSAVSLGINWSLRWRALDASANDTLVSELGDLLQSPNERTVLSAAMLLDNIAANSRADGPGNGLRDLVRGALITRLMRADPLLDIGAGLGRDSLRDTLTSLVFGTPAIDETVELERAEWDDRRTGITAEDSPVTAVEKAATVNLKRVVKRYINAPLELSTPQRALFDEAMLDLLHIRVGSVLALGVHAEMLDEFSLIVTERDSRGALAWVDATRPDYRAVVQQEHARLHAEVTGSDGLVALLRKLAP